MKDQVIELVEIARSTPGGERSIGSNFGFALGSGGQRDVANAYGDAILVPAQLADDDPAREVFLRGYLTAVRDVAMAFLRGLDERRATDPRTLVEWVMSRDVAMFILKLARKNGLAREGDVVSFFSESRRPDVRLVLEDMVDRRLLQIVPSSEPSYTLTGLGQRVVDSLVVTL